MAMLEMLAEVVGAEELLRFVTLTEFVYVVEVFRAKLPARRIGKFFSTVATNIGTVASHGLVEGCFRAGERSTRPRVASQMEGVLVAFCFVLVFEAVRTISAAILLLGFMQPGI
jgi:hypothetical protein